MTGLKKGGIILTGIGAYLILSKAINMVGRSVKNVSEAMKWKAYYNSNNETAVPPGYSLKYKEGSEDSKTEACTEKASGEVLGRAITSAIETLLNKGKRENDPLEGQTEASTDDISEEKEELEVIDAYPENDEGSSVAEETSPEEEGDDIS